MHEHQQASRHAVDKRDPADVTSPRCTSFMLIIALCVSLGAVCALLATAAASQLRQRNVAALEVEVRRVWQRTSQPCVHANDATTFVSCILACCTRMPAPHPGSSTKALCCSVC